MPVWLVLRSDTCSCEWPVPRRHGAGPPLARPHLGVEATACAARFPQVLRQTVVRELSWSQLSLCGTAQRLRECAQPGEARRALRSNWRSVPNETSNLRELVCSCQLAWTVELAPLRCHRHWCHAAHVGSKKHHLSEDLPVQPLLQGQVLCLWFN